MAQKLFNICLLIKPLFAQVLIEILASRSNNEIKAIREVYKKEYKNELEKDIEGDTSGDFRRLLIALNNVS